MTTLILGAAASGKSEYAETLTLSYGMEHIYLATMENKGSTAQRRIARHRQLRAEKGFFTIECPRNLTQLQLPEAHVLLLECVSNLFANEMYTSYPPIAAMEAAERCLAGIESLKKQAVHTVLVSNNVFDDGRQYDAETEEYIHGLAWLNQELARQADAVTEVVCGIPLKHKEKNNENIL